MQFDSQERHPLFYVVLVGLLIFAIVFFVNNVKKAINSNKAKEEAKKTSISTVIYDI